MNSILIAIGFIFGVTTYMLVKWLFFNKKKESTYEPTGKLGFKRYNTASYKFVIIVEKVDEIVDKIKKDGIIKIKIIEVSVDRECDKTIDECLAAWGGNNWVRKEDFTWNEKSAAEVREEKIDGLVV